MNYVVDYFILAEGSRQELMDEVIKMIRMGWQPWGGVCFGDGSFIQIMVVYKD